MESLLAFDTATEQVHLALAVGERTWRREFAGGARASADLIPSILALLAEAGSSLAALDAIAFGRGPGAFTGLRTACAVAQGLAYGAGKPVLALDTLLAVADDARAGRPGWSGWVVVDARMGEVYAAAYRFDANGWHETAAPRLATPAALSEAWRSDPPAALAGSALEAFGEQLVAEGATRQPSARPRGEALLALARSAWRAGRTIDPALALPLYLRDKVAQTTAEREAAREARALAAGAVS